MRIKQKITHCNLSKMKKKILPTYLQGNNRDSLGEFSNMSYGVFGGEWANNNQNHAALLWDRHGPPNGNCSNCSRLLWVYENTVLLPILSRFQCSSDNRDETVFFFLISFTEHN